MLLSEKIALGCIVIFGSAQFARDQHSPQIMLQELGRSGDEQWNISTGALH